MGILQIKNHFINIRPLTMDQAFTRIYGMKRSLRSVNNCFQVPNLFSNKSEQNLTENIEFIPKHIRRKIIQKQHLNCKDIMDLKFLPQRPRVDIVTVKTAVKVQEKYRNIIEQRDRKTKNQCWEPKNILSLKVNSIKQQAVEQIVESNSLIPNEKDHQQCMKVQIPTQKQLKKQEVDELQQFRH